MISGTVTSNVYFNLALPTTDWAGLTRRTPDARSRASETRGGGFGMLLAKLSAMPMKDPR